MKRLSKLLKSGRAILDICLTEVSVRSLTSTLGAGDFSRLFSCFGRLYRDPSENLVAGGFGV